MPRRRFGRVYGGGGAASEKGETTTRGKKDAAVFRFSVSETLPPPPPPAKKSEIKTLAYGKNRPKREKNPPLALCTSYTRR